MHSSISVAEPGRLKKDDPLSNTVEKLETEELDLQARWYNSESFELAYSHAEAQKEADEKAALKGEIATLLIEHDAEKELRQEERLEQEEEEEEDLLDDIIAEEATQDSPETDPLRRVFQMGGKGSQSSVIQALMRTYKSGLTKGNLMTNFDNEYTTDPVLLEKLLQHKRGLSRHCVLLSRSVLFQLFFAAVIICNAGVMAFEANYSLVTARDWSHSTAGVVVSNMFTVLFLVEVVVNVYGSQGPVLKDPYLVFDIVIVSIGVLDNWIVTPISMALQTGESIDLYFLTTLRIFRLLRVTKLFRLVRFLRPFRILFICFANCVHVLFWMTMVLFFISFITAIFIFSLIANVDETVPNGYPSGTHPSFRFANFGISLMTLHMVVIRGINWGSEIFQPLQHGSLGARLAAFIFLQFMIFCTICMSNLLCALFVERLFSVAGEDEETVRREGFVKHHDDMQELHDILVSLDSNNDGHLSKQEFKLILEQEGNFGRICELLEVCSIAEAQELFKQVRGHEKKLLAIDDFLLAVMKLKRPSSLDMLSIEYQQQKAWREIRSMAVTVKSDSRNIQQMVGIIQDAIADADKQVVELRGECQKLLQAEEDDLCEELPALSHFIIGEENAEMVRLQHARKKLIHQRLEDSYRCRSRLERIGHQLDGLTAADALWTRLSSAQAAPQAERSALSLWGTAKPGDRIAQKIQSLRAADNQVRLNRTEALPASIKIDLDIWRNILEEDVKPFLTEYLADLQDTEMQFDNDAEEETMQDDVTITGEASLLSNWGHTLLSQGSLQSTARSTGEASLLSERSLRPISNGSHWAGHHKLVSTSGSQSSSPDRTIRSHRTVRSLLEKELLSPEKS